MGDIVLKDGNDAVFIADTFSRMDNGVEVQAQAVVPIDPVSGLPNAATEATLSALKVAIDALKTTVDALNAKTTVVDTGAVSVVNFPAPVSDPALATVAQDATALAIRDMNDSMLYALSAILEKMPRLDRTDRLTVDLSDYGIGGSAWATSYINGVSNPFNGAEYKRLLEPWQFSDAGCARLYQQIIVS